MNLISEASYDFRLVRLPFHLTRFPYIVGQRFLAKHVFSPPHSIKGDLGVHMVRSGYRHCVDRVSRFGEHFPEILKHGDLRP